jgi:uncharacterized protein (DUF1330 family)
MTLEMLVGLNVTDDEKFQTYRRHMTPILEGYGGGFGYDFKVSEVLKSRANDRINRVFTIYFQDKASKDAFFENAEYLRVKKRYFEPAVADTVILAIYEPL